MIEKKDKNPDGHFDPSDNTYVKIKKHKRIEPQSGHSLTGKNKSKHSNSKSHLREKQFDKKAADLNTISAITKSMNEDLT